MGSPSIEYIADLGSFVPLRVVSSSDRHVSIETTARKNERIATVDVSTGEVTISSTELPLLNLKDAKWSGQRWATARNGKQRNGDPRTTITWQDCPRGGVFAAEIVGGKCVSMACPKDCNSVLIGTRRHKWEGDGRIYCVREGKVVWSYQPTEVAVYPYLHDLTKNTLTRAYPYHIACSDTMDRVVFSFLNYVYVLNSSGELLKRWGVGELLENLFDKRFYNPSVVRETHEIGDWVYESQISAPMYEQPIVLTLAAPADAPAIIFSSKNAVVWLTPNGEVAHWMELPIGRCAGMGNAGEITRLKVTPSGQIVVAEVCVDGFCVIENGKLAGVSEEGSLGRPWDISEKHGCIAVGSGERMEIELFDWHWRRLQIVHVGFPIGDLWFSEDGRYLVASVCGGLVVPRGKSAVFVVRSQGTTVRSPNAG